MTSPTLIAESDVAQAAQAPALHSQSSPLHRHRLQIAVPFALFALTLLSTTCIGMRYMANFRNNRPPLASDADILPLEWVVHHLSALPSGLPFSLTLIAILLAHEFGHFFACRAYRVRCSLPYLLPAPSLSGSFGAIIQLRSRVRSPGALITIGAMGPICGFLVAVATTALGLSISRFGSEPLTGNIQAPLLVTLLDKFLRGFTVPHATLAHILPHPVLVASWMGILITAINLIPAGQLDGGHILFAVAPRAHRGMTRLAVGALVVLGMVSWIGWLLWAGILLMPGMRHPSIPDPAPVTGWQLALVPACFGILLLAFTFAPFAGYSLIQVVQKLAHHR